MSSIKITLNRTNIKKKIVIPLLQQSIHYLLPHSYYYTIKWPKVIIVI